jgi:hypothetical protein
VKAVVLHRQQRLVLVAALSLALVELPAGCRSAYVEADIVNGTANSVSLVELDYPSASFGTGALAAGQTFHYRFKILGSGATKILWTDAAHHDHSVAGPTLQEGQQGSLTVTIRGDKVDWASHLAR